MRAGEVVLTGFRPAAIREGLLSMPGEDHVFHSVEEAVRTPAPA
jgi:hypothetical protein